MIRKLTQHAKNTLRTELIQVVSGDLQKINEKLDETMRLARENILEERQREQKHLSGGTFHISPREVVTKIFDDSIMYLDPKDIAVVPHIILQGIWERQVTSAWITSMEGRDLTVLDIGANFGYFGMLAASRLDKKKSKVILFEANPNLLPYIHKTLSVNWLNENTIVEGLAVSDKIGTAELSVLEDYTGSSSMHSIDELKGYLSHKMEIKAENVIKVPTISIDEYCKKHKISQIDLIKMDIEGYEDIAYKGMRGMIAASPDPVLFIEFTKDGYKNPKAFYDQMLDDFGNVYLISPNGKFIKPKNESYAAVAGNIADWIMLVFTKQVKPHDDDLTVK